MKCGHHRLGTCMVTGMNSDGPSPRPPQIAALGRSCREVPEGIDAVDDRLGQDPDREVRGRQHPVSIKPGSLSQSCGEPAGAPRRSSFSASTLAAHAFAR
jgi:hypothetical protein